jgi:phosphoglycolate phosphatase
MTKLAIGVMVGDRHHDVDAGRAHGLHTIGVTWGIGSAAELGEAGADHVVDAPSQLEELLLAVGSR